MIFAVYGLVKFKGKKIANGVDGKFETNRPSTITRLTQLGFKEYVPPATVPVVGQTTELTVTEKAKKERPKKK